ncbi:hypothetical protein CW304_01440 [Bacillus sp. UFRGS-B20]|nr:hypothetical protein CW304_01440 [Bacillus sp. UFRGS-B20]
MKISIFQVNMKICETAITRQDTLYIQCAGEKKMFEVAFKPYLAIKIKNFGNYSDLIRKKGMQSTCFSSKT